MSLRLEMLQVARLAPKVLEDSAELVHDFLLRQLNADGGFTDRTGRSDLYYTVFGIDGLIALQAELPRGKNSVLRAELRRRRAFGFRPSLLPCARPSCCRLAERKNLSGDRPADRTVSLSRWRLQSSAGPGARDGLRMFSRVWSLSGPWPRAAGCSTRGAMSEGSRNRRRRMGERPRRKVRVRRMRRPRR